MGLLEIVAIGYLALGAISAILLWLIQLGSAAASDDPASADGPSLVVVLLVAGLAWPLSLPLAAAGWLKETRGDRSNRRRPPGGARTSPRRT